MENSPILCFEHCQRNVRISCITIPTACPLCGCSTESSPMRLPPFRLPTPFSSSNSQPSSILVKPTNGSFLQDYTQDDDLHIGISNTKCEIYAFDCEGLTCTKNPWLQCIVIPISKITGKQPESLDAVLKDTLTESRWNMKNYNESQYNCYSYVLDVLWKIGCVDMECDKVAFSTQFLVPQTTRAAVYIDMYRKILKEGFVISEKWR